MLIIHCFWSCFYKRPVYSFDKICCMKYLLFIIFIISISGCIHPRYAESKFPDPFEFKMTDSLDATKDTLLSKSRRWLSEKEGIRFYEAKRGKMAATGFMRSTSKLCMLTCVSKDYYVQYRISLTVKEGAYTLVLSDFFLNRDIISEKDTKMVDHISLNRQKHPSSVNHIVWTNLKEDCYKNSQTLMQIFKEYMHNPSANL